MAFGSSSVSLAHVTQPADEHAPAEAPQQGIAPSAMGASHATDVAPVEAAPAVVTAVGMHAEVEQDAAALGHVIAHEEP